MDDELRIGQAVSAVLKRRTVKSGEERRRDILDAALGLFAEHGYRDTTVDQIAARAGVAKGTVYLYFEAKEDLLLALKRRYLEGLTEVLKAAVDTTLARIAEGEQIDPRTVVDSLFDTLADPEVADEKTMAVVVAQIDNPDFMAAVRKLENEVTTVMAGALDRAREAGIVHVTDSEMTARLLHTAVREHIARAVCDGEVDLERVVAAGRELCYKALSPYNPYLD